MSGLARVLWGPQGVVGGTLMPLCLNEGHVSELQGTHRRGWPRRGLCRGLHVSALEVEGGLCGLPLPVALRTQSSVLRVLGCAWHVQVPRYLVCSGGRGPIRSALASEPSVGGGGVPASLWQLSQL